MPTRASLLFASGRLPADLGARIVSARGNADLTRIALASATGVAPQTLARIERGAQRPTPATLRALAGRLGVALDDLAPAWGRDEDERATSGAVAPGIAVRVLRRRLGLTQADIAAAAGVSVSTVSRFERAIHAPRGITSTGDAAAGASGLDDLAITSSALAAALGFATPLDLTRACAAIEAED